MNKSEAAQLLETLSAALMRAPDPAVFGAARAHLQVALSEISAALAVLAGDVESKPMHVENKPILSAEVEASKPGKWGKVWGGIKKVLPYVVPVVAVASGGGAAAAIPAVAELLSDPAIATTAAGGAAAAVVAGANAIKAAVKKEE